MDKEPPDWEAFGRAIMDEWPELYSFDPYDLQELATKHHLLVPEQRTTYCKDSCNCAEFEQEGEEWTCFRLNFQRPTP